MQLPSSSDGFAPNAGVVGSHRRLSRLGVGALCVALLVALPILSVALTALRSKGDTWSHLLDTVIVEYAWTTALLAGGVAIGVVLLGVGAAWLVANYRFPGHGWLQWALILPLAMPAYVIAYAYTDWLQFSGPVQSALRAWTGWRAGEYWFPDARSLPAAMALFAFVLYPYVYLLVRSALIEQSASAVEAARLMGLRPFAAFTRVALPLARPAIAAGVALALMETLADFGAVSYFGVQTLTAGIFRAWQAFGDRGAAAQIAMLLLIFVAVVIAIERAGRGRARFQAAATPRRLIPAQLSGWPALAAAVLCAVPFALGFAIPAILLARLALQAEETMALARLWGVLVNTVWLGALAALLAVAAALLLGYAGRLSKHRMVDVANRLAGLGYAIPGAVIAVGILLPLAALDNFVADWLRETFGIRVGLLLTGSVFALLFAYLVRFLSIALQTVEAGLTRVTPSMDDAARSLGLSARATLRRVHVPIMRGSVLTASLLVFVDVMKELPATFALRPFNFDTLAISIYNLAKDERLAEAALPSLVIVLVGLIPLVLVSRRMALAERGR